jgi:hypothetical protein
MQMYCKTDMEWTTTEYVRYNYIYNVDTSYVGKIYESNVMQGPMVECLLCYENYEIKTPM